MDIENNFMNSFKSFAQRLVSIPKKVDNIVINGGKAHCNQLNIVMVKGLMKNNLVKPPLSSNTINQKIQESKPHIYTALVGWGQYRKDSMINGLRIKGSGKKWRLVPVGIHYSKLPQVVVWTIHEFGAVIQAKSQNGKPYLIKIPPRMPLRRGLQRYLKSVKKNEVNKLMEKSLKAFIENNKKDMIRVEKDFKERVDESIN